MARPIVTKFGVVGTSARADVSVPFSAARKRLDDCAEIWYVIRDPLARLLRKLRVGHSCMCARATPFCISETAGRIALKFAVWSETK